MKSPAVFSVGLLATFNNAVMTFVGAVVVPAGVVRVKSVPQAEPSPEAPPAELMQAATMSARLSILATGTIVPCGTLRPGANPVEGFTNSEARTKALANEDASELDDPILAGEVIKGKSAETAAAVVNSLITMNVDEVNESQRPRLVIMAMAALFVPCERPGLPPVATTYVSEAGVGQLNWFVRLKFPLASDTTG